MSHAFVTHAPVSAISMPHQHPVGKCHTATPHSLFCIMFCQTGQMTADMHSPRTNNSLLAVMQFVDSSSRLLSTAEREISSGWFAKEESKPGAAKSLRMFMESFVTEKFLPEIYLDFRSAITHSCVLDCMVPEWATNHAVAHSKWHVVKQIHPAKLNALPV